MMTSISFLWSPYGTGQTIRLYFCSVVCSFFLFSSPNLSRHRMDSRRRLDVCHILPRLVWPSANLECRSEMCCTRLAGNAGPENRQKFDIWAPSHNVVGLYLRKALIVNREKIVKQQYFLHMSSQYSELRPFSDSDRSGSLGQPS